MVGLKGVFLARTAFVRSILLCLLLRSEHNRKLEEQQVIRRGSVVLLATFCKAEGKQAIPISVA